MFMFWEQVACQAAEQQEFSFAIAQAGGATRLGINRWQITQNRRPHGSDRVLNCLCEHGAVHRGPDIFSYGAESC